MTEPKTIAPNSKHEKRNERKIPKRITETYLHNAGLYYLERYSASSNHFKTVMKRKVRRSCMHHEDQSYDDCAALVEKLVEKFIQSGLLDDDLYLKGMVGSYRRKGLSCTMIIQKLLAKGVSPDLTATYLKQYDEDTSHTKEDAEKKAAAIFSRRKKIGAFRTKPQDEQKEIAKLARAGYRYETIKCILQMTQQEMEDVIYT